MNKKLVFMALITMVLFSCTPQKKLIYFQDNKDKDSTTYAIKDFTLNIQKKDIITLQLYTVNPEAVPGLASTMDERTVDNRTFYEKGFIIDEGLSMKEARDSIQNRYSVMIQDPLVVIKKLSFKFTILGEVAKPGLYYANNEKLTMSEALGMAGDLTFYGSRNDVKIFRTENGKVQEIMLDLTSKEAVTTDKMYVHPDDVIYVRAFKKKALANILPATQVITSITSTLILVATFFLIKNN
jgi:polysaccharide biosynthesis/export protein